MYKYDIKQNYKVSCSQVPQVYLTPVEIQHYLSVTLIHSKEVGFLKASTGLFFTLVRVL